MRLGLIHPEWFEFRPGLWMQLNVTDLIQETILLEGLWDPCLTKFIESKLQPGDVFIDIGAHVGYFSLLAAKRVGSEGKVLSIEPNPFSLEQLTNNVKRSEQSNVLIEHTAVSDANDVVHLFLHDESNTSMASLSSSNATGGTAVEVPCTTVANLVEKHSLNRADLIKIDVEGAELSVLRGMSTVLRDLHPAIVLELEPHLLKSFGSTPKQVEDLFAEHGYSVSPLGGHGNFLAEHNDTKNS